MKGAIPPNSHELAKLESRIKLIYFLRDIGVIDTHVATQMWLHYCEILASVATEWVDINCTEI
jgi:hypothetical protein